MFVQIALSPLFMLRAAAKVVRRLAATLAWIAVALVMLVSPPHPDNCDPEKPGSTQQAFTTAQTMSPATASNADPFNPCPGAPQFSVGDFKFC